MSYHVQQNTQQRSFGIFIVIAFHVLLIWGLANGLGNTIINAIAPPPPIKVTNIQKKITAHIVEPTLPVIQPKQHVLVQPNTPLVIIQSTEPQSPIVTSSNNHMLPIGPSLSKPTLKNATKPIYPSTAARLGEEGTTGLRLYITPEGRVSEVQIFSPSGSQRLDEAAIKHAKRNWSFSACTEGGKAVGCWFKTNLVWRLEDAAR